MSELRDIKEQFDLSVLMLFHFWCTDYKGASWFKGKYDSEHQLLKQMQRGGWLASCFLSSPEAEASGWLRLGAE